MAVVKCAECGKQEEYELKPGFPRKYCTECAAIKKAQYQNKHKVAPATEANREVSSEDFDKDGKLVPKQIHSDRESSIIAQTMMKCFFYGNKAENPEHVKAVYDKFLKML